MKTIVNEQEQFITPSSHEWYITEIPHLVAREATIELLKDYYPHLNYSGIRLIDVVVDRVKKIETTDKVAIKAAKLAVERRSDLFKLIWEVDGRDSNQINLSAKLPPPERDPRGGLIMVGVKFQIFSNGDLRLSINGYPAFIDNLEQVIKVLKS
jgi:hypothetical protein